METNNPLITVFSQGPVEIDRASKGRVGIRLGQGAAAGFIVLQEEPDSVERVTAFDIRLGSGSSLDMVFISLSGGMIRNVIDARLEGEGAACNLAGLYLPDGKERMEYDIQLTHLVPGCSSNQLFKGIISGEGVSSFNGLIKVVPDAQKTEAYQANHNLLSSDEARAYTKPQLEIYADDVKCSHGATVGRLNPDELFYMRSRGITLTEALLLQQMAFTGEVIDRISSPELRESIRSKVEDRLRRSF